MTRGKTHCLEVWGELACFTRPEMKVERYSYPVITPSAARGIFDAIYWKKSYGFYWQVERIEILRPPKYLALRRNEVKDKAPPERTISAWMTGRERPEPLWADGSKDELGTDQKGRTQRQTMALKDVRYRLYAHMRLRSEQTDFMALDAQFERRASQGKCFYQPFLGCREFPAFFELVQEGAKADAPIALDLDLGYMLYDVFDLRQDNNTFAKPAISVFHAQVRKGVMEVPPYEDPAVKKSCREVDDD
ncbi:MAG: type I-C CRISPR-associated protein Cas5c [Thiobacillaceae bacterium]|nr:type I-C CRISPR-associated protein Cas5c [Thiobacillaceae bacterium]MDW8324702.1 type I-C CRISPR-associated protein Cas5c [Burkholderiales bacterium]